MCAWVADKLVVLHGWHSVLCTRTHGYICRPADRPVIYGQDTYNKPELQRGLLLLGRLLDRLVGWQTKKKKSIFCDQHLAKSLQFAFIFIVVMPCSRFCLSAIHHHPLLSPFCVPFSYASYVFFCILFFGLPGRTDCLPACLLAFFFLLPLCRWQLQLFDAWFVERLFAFSAFLCINSKRNLAIVGGQKQCSWHWWSLSRFVFKIKAPYALLHRLLVSLTLTST